jgi:hypothetical protein
MGHPNPDEYGTTTFTSEDSPLIEFSDADQPAEMTSGLSVELTEKYLLMLMRSRVKRHEPPLPDNFVPPPGIDIAALLRQVPWPPTE